MGKRVVVFAYVFEHRRQMFSPIEESLVEFAHGFGRDRPFHTAVELYTVTDKAKETGLIARCHDGKAGSSGHLVLIAGLPIESPDLCIFVHLHMVKGGHARGWTSVELLKSGCNAGSINGRSVEACDFFIIVRAYVFKV